MAGKDIIKYVVVVLLMAVLIAAFAHAYLQTEKVVTVTATIEEVMAGGDEGPQVTAISAGVDRINLLKYPKDIPANFPGVYVLMVHEGHRINYWTSVPYTGSGTYNLTVGLGSVPPDGSEVRVIVTVNDKDGKRIAMNTTNIVL
ncbi:MAG: hypothetical protein U9N46_06390 [Euryarchaeota archaeon]|nr:hypothetical protein [Euryarchaeota archaeon]